MSGSATTLGGGEIVVSIVVAVMSQCSHVVVCYFVLVHLLGYSLMYESGLLFFFDCLLSQRVVALIVLGQRLWRDAVCHVPQVACHRYAVCPTLSQCLSFPTLRCTILAIMVIQSMYGGDSVGVVYGMVPLLCYHPVQLTFGAVLCDQIRRRIPQTPSA